MEHHKKPKARALPALRTKNASVTYFNRLPMHFSFAPCHHAVFGLFLTLHGEISGLEKGRLEGKLEVAERLLLAGLELSLIEKTTGIDIKKLIDLQKKLGGDGH